MSNERSPRPSRSMTMGTSGMSVRSFAVVVVQPLGCVCLLSVSCNPMVARDITIDGDPDEVWEALNDPELLAEWLREDGEALGEGGAAAARLGVWGLAGGRPGPPSLPSASSGGSTRTTSRARGSSCGSWRFPTARA